MRTLRFIFIGLLVGTSCSGRFDERARSGNRGILATGTCIKKITQDRGTVTLTTSVLAPTATESSQMATQESEKLKAAVDALKLPDATLQTTGFSVYEEREYQDKKTISKGFRTRVGLSVETSDISRLGEAIAAASKLGVKEIDSLSTFVSPQKMKSEYESCLEVATSNARDKAEKLAKGAGVKLGKVILIEEGINPANSGDGNESYSKGIRSVMAAAPQADMGSAPSISARAENITVSASVKFTVD